MRVFTQAQLCRFFVRGCIKNRQNFAQAHVRLRDGARFIDAEHIDARQRFNAFHIVQQHLFAYKTDGAQCKGDGGEKIQPLGNHADDRSDHGGNASLHGFVIDEIALAKQDDRDWDHGNADPFDNTVDGADHFGLLRALHLLCLRAQAHDIGIVADAAEHGAPLPCRDKAAAEQLIAACFCNFIRFAAEQRFVDRKRAVEQHGIRGDLIARVQNNNIVKHKLLRRHGQFFPVAHDTGMRLCKQIHFVQHGFGAQLLNDADQSVA